MRGHSQKRGYTNIFKEGDHVKIREKGKSGKYIIPAVIVEKRD